MTNSTSSTYGLALFDVAGTLTTGNTWAAMINYPKIDRSKRLKLKLWAYPAWIGTKFGLYSETVFRERWIRSMADMVKGWHVDEVQHLFEWLVDKHTVPNLYDNMVEIVKRHKAEGSHVIFVSNMFTDAVNRVALKLGADVGLGTTLEIIDDHATGNIIGMSCAGENKLKIVSNYLAENNLDLSLENSIAYSDSFSDRHMLNGVSKAIATYPDRRLLKYALEQDWQIFPTTSSLSQNILDG